MKNNENYREFTLDNGLVIALQRTPTQTIYAQLRFHHGGVHENSGEEGIAHFLEHNIIDGGSEKYSPEEIKKIRAKFPMSNASTYNSETSYIAGIFPEDLELFLDFSSSIAFTPRLDNNIIEIQRQRVLREISDKKGQPAFNDEREFLNSLYRNKFHPYFVLGEEEVVFNANQESLKKFHSRGYGPNNADLILVGALPNNTEQLIEKYFFNISRGLGEKFNFPHVNTLKEKVMIHSTARDLQNKDNLQESNAEISIGFIVPHIKQRETYSTALLNLILGGNSNSRLYKSLSEKAGLAYYMGSKYGGTQNVGAIRIYGKAHANRYEEALDKIFEELRKFRDESIEEYELETNKNTLRYRLAKNAETNVSILENVIELKLDYNIIMEDYLSNMAKITKEDVQEIAQKYLPKSRDDDNYVILIRDPLKK